MEGPKAILLICDGMADRPVAQLGAKTPLEAANNPNMNAMALQGICGVIDPIAPGIRAGSDTSHLAILGFDPFKVYTGREPVRGSGHRHGCSAQGQHRVSMQLLDCQ